MHKHTEKTYINITEWGRFHWPGFLAILLVPVTVSVPSLETTVFCLAHDLASSSSSHLPIQAPTLLLSNIALLHYRPEGITSALGWLSESRQNYAAQEFRPSSILSSFVPTILHLIVCIITITWMLCITGNGGGGNYRHKKTPRKRSRDFKSQMNI